MSPAKALPTAIQQSTLREAKICKIKQNIIHNAVPVKKALYQQLKLPKQNTIMRQAAAATTTTVAAALAAAVTKHSKAEKTPENILSLLVDGKITDLFLMKKEESKKHYIMKKEENKKHYSSKTHQ